MDYIKIFIYLSLRIFPKSNFFFNISNIKNKLINNKISTQKKFDNIRILYFYLFINTFKIFLNFGIKRSYQISQILKIYIKLYSIQRSDKIKLNLIKTNVLNLIRNDKIDRIPYKSLKLVIDFLKQIKEFSSAENLLLYILKNNKNNSQIKIELAKIYFTKSFFKENNLNKTKPDVAENSKSLIDEDLILKSKNLLNEVISEEDKNNEAKKVMSGIDFFFGNVSKSAINHRTYLNSIRLVNSNGENSKFYPIFIISPSRTSATFIYKTLMKKFNKKFFSTSSHYYKFNSALLYQNDLIKFASTNNSISHSHIGPEKINLNLINMCMDKIVINLRDPRQELISIIRNHMEAWSKDPVRFYQTSDHRPNDYIKFSLVKKVLYEIDNGGYFKDILNYINGWLNAEKDSQFLTKILFTVQEDLKKNPKDFFNSILNFYDVDKKYFFNGNEEYLNIAEYDGRKGPQDEWRHNLPEKVIQEMNNKMPKILFSKFNWKQ